MKRNPLLRQLAEHRQSYVTAEQQDHSTTPTQEKSFDMFQSVTSNFSRYDSAREKTTDLSDDAMSLGQASSSLMYYSGELGKILKLRILKKGKYKVQTILYLRIVAVFK